MKLNLPALQDRTAWEAAGVALPHFDIAAMQARTKQAPLWLHFGAGNIFRGFIAVLQQRLLEHGLSERGIIAADTFDYDVIDRIYTPYDNLSMSVTLNTDASFDMEVVASVAEALRADAGDAGQMARLAEIIVHPGLQLLSFTITEKGYALNRADGTLLPVVEQDMQNGPEHPIHAMSITAALLYKRYRSGGWPLAVVSMDNCSHNGEKLQSSVLAIASAWVNNGLVESGFLSWLLDDSKITFPWSMIDKITPRPAETVEAALKEKGIEDMHPIVTAKNTFIAPFVNAEKAQYLVIEDSFPNGRPPLEQAGVFLTDRDTVNRVERMKVTTCLNPLHTAMSVYGCLLGYTRIWQEMQDADIVALITRLGYVEGLPVVTDPGILDPKEFLREVLEVRLPNPFMPDAPQRIATDTSQKVGIRFGETVKSYVERNLPLSTLVSLPLALAGWFRYLLAVDDALMPIEVSQDPMKEELQRQLMGVVPGQPLSYRGQLRPILQNVAIFGMDLTKTPLAGNVEAMFIELLQGAGAVRDTLHRHLAE